MLRAYHDLALQTDHDLSLTENVATILKRLSNGWVARYQVFSLANAPKLVLSLSCPLDESKVWIQIRQSLWKEGQGTAADTCKLQCPATISKSLRRFSVLGDVYTLLHSDNNSPSYRVSSLQLHFNEAIREAWNAGAYENDGHTEASLSNPVTPGSWTHRSPQLYLYWLWFSMDGRFVFFLDKGPAKLNNIAVFDFGQADSSSHPVLVNHQGAQLHEGSKQIQCDMATFHPSQPLVAFSVVGSVYIWAYENGKVILRTWRHPLTFIDLSGLCQLLCGFDSFESVTFTSCGRFVIIKPVTAMYPIIKEIPKKLRQLIDETEISKAADAESGDRRDIDKRLILPRVSDFEVLPSGVVNGHQVTMRTDGSTKGISTSRGSHNNVRVHLWSDGVDSRSEANFEFSKLPEWFAAEGISTSLLPQLRQERIRMVIDQSRRPWSDLSQKRGSWPILVERHRRSIDFSYRRRIEAGLSTIYQPDCVQIDPNQPRVVARRYPEHLQVTDARGPNDNFIHWFLTIYSFISSDND